MFVPEMATGTLTVKKLADLSGMSVRSLHHYDNIGLLSPSKRGENGYRLYSHNDLLRLQQILFYKELDFPLHQIKEILSDPEYSTAQALISHRKAIESKMKRYETLLQTIEETLITLKQEGKIMKTEDLYKGFDKGLEYRKEASEKWGEEKVKESEEKLAALGKEGFEKLKEEGEEINALLADLMHLPPGNDTVQHVIGLHFKHIGNFRELTTESYSALGKMYVEDERFKATYDKVKPGMAKFLNEGIQHFCKNRKA